MSIRMALCNRKGGTGKTTVSVNLATELAVLGYRVLLIDLDSQSHCAEGLGVQRSGPTIHDVLTDPTLRIDDTIKETQQSNLWLSIAKSGVDHRNFGDDTHTLKHILDTFEHSQTDFDVILLDTPPSMDALLMNALMAAHWVLVPFVPHHLSFEGIKQLVKVLYSVKMGGNPQLQLKGFLPTMASSVINHHKATMEKVANQFGLERLLPGIRNDIKLADAFSHGLPVRHFAPSCRGSDDFRQLAGLLDQQIQAIETPSINLESSRGESVA